MEAAVIKRMSLRTARPRLSRWDRDIKGQETGVDMISKLPRIVSQQRQHGRQESSSVFESATRNAIAIAIAGHFISST
jgi:hypothetical protein